MYTKPTDLPDALLALRKAAEKLLTSTMPNGLPYPLPAEIENMIHNVSAQQARLETQNGELKASNFELDMQRAWFAGLFNLAPVGYFTISKNGLVEDANIYGLQMLGVFKQDFIGSRFQNLITPECRGIFTDFLKILQSSGVKQSCQVTMRIARRKLLYAQVEGIRTDANQGDTAKYFLAVIDIAERDDAVLKLAANNERLNIALSASGAGTWEIDLNNGRIFLDSFSKKIFGYTDDNYDGRPDSFLMKVLPEDRKLVERNLITALQGKELDIEFRIRKPDDQVYCIGARGHVTHALNGDKSFVGILMDISQKKHLEAEAIRLKKNADKNITLATLQTQENERKRISETLHDSVSQLLYAIKLNLDGYATDPDSLKKVNHLLNMAIQETRNISFELAPSILTDFGLAITIGEMCKRLSTASLSVKHQAYGLKQRLGTAMEINIFRIIQELVNNCIKHAAATVIKITLTCEHKSVKIQVSDNGKGFNYHDEYSKHPGGSGLNSIKNRLILFNGTLRVESKPPHGTIVTAVLEQV